MSSAAVRRNQTDHRNIGDMNDRQFVDAVREVVGLRPLYWAPEPSALERFNVPEYSSREFAGYTILGRIMPHRRCG